MGSENKYDALISLAKEAAVQAGIKVMEIYNSSNSLEIVSKSDNSPLTQADMASHKAITSLLAGTSIPVLSEEGKSIPYEERSKWEQFWLIDPLDGTKEFINRNGEFTVNIALVLNGSVAFGVVYVPFKEELFWGGKGLGAFRMGKDGIAAPISCKKSIDGEVVIVASRSHSNQQTQDFIDRYPGCKLSSVGSSLKLLQVAEGVAHIYPRFGPTMEWDTCAAQGVVEGADGYVINPSNNLELNYNKENLLNPFFIVCGSKDFLNIHA